MKAIYAHLWSWHARRALLAQRPFSFIASRFTPVFTPRREASA